MKNRDARKVLQLLPKRDIPETKIKSSLLVLVSFSYDLLWFMLIKTGKMTLFSGGEQYRQLLANALNFSCLFYLHFCRTIL